MGVSLTPTPTPTPFPTTAPSSLDEGVSCKPNISAAGRRLRMRAGYLWAAVTIAAVAIGILLRLPWFVRALVVVPAGLSAVGILQAVRGTCLKRAAEGTFEHDDFSKNRVAEPDAVRSRLAAATIGRDTLIIAGLCGAAAAASVLLR